MKEFILLLHITFSRATNAREEILLIAIDLTVCKRMDTNVELQQSIGDFDVQALYNIINRHEIKS